MYIECRQCSFGLRVAVSAAARRCACFYYGLSWECLAYLSLIQNWKKAVGHNFWAMHVISTTKHNIVASYILLEYYYVLLCFFRWTGQESAFVILK